jgi:hypothetical protein
MQWKGSGVEKEREREGEREREREREGEREKERGGAAWPILSIVVLAVVKVNDLTKTTLLSLSDTVPSLRTRKPSYSLR